MLLTIIYISLDTVTQFPSEGGSYLCYKITESLNVPTSQILQNTSLDNNIDNTFSVDLLSPIPKEGTIFMAFGTYSHFSLRIQNSYLIYKYKENNHTSHLKDLFPSINITIDNRDIAYHVDLIIHRQQAELNLKNIQDGNTSFGNIKIPGIKFHESFFPSVCVGGSLLDIKNYEGRMKEARFNNISLFDENNTCLFRSRRHNTSDYISLATVRRYPSLFTVERFTLRAQIISFQFRTNKSLFRPGSLPMALLTVTFGITTLALVINPTSFGLIVQLGPLHALEFTPYTPNNNWHEVIILTSYIPRRNDISFKLDGVSHKLEGIIKNSALENIIDAPLTFGQLIETNTNLLRSFTGCMRNFKFQETPTSIINRLNLETLNRIDNDGYNFSKRCISCLYPCPRKLRCFYSGYYEVLACVDREIQDTGIRMKCSSEFQ